MTVNGEVLRGGADPYGNKLLEAIGTIDHLQFDSQPMFDDIMPGLQRKTVLDLKKALESDKPQFRVIIDGSNKSVSFARISSSGNSDPKV